MRRYYFDTERSGLLYHDVDGLELSSVDEARRELLKLLRDLTFADSTEDLSVEVTAQVRCNGDVMLRGRCIVSVLDRSL